MTVIKIGFFILKFINISSIYTNSLRSKSTYDECPRRVYISRRFVFGMELNKVICVLISI